MGTRSCGRSVTVFYNSWLVCHDTVSATRQRQRLRLTRGPYARIHPPLLLPFAETEQISAAVDGGYVCSVGTTFVTSQCCTAVSIDTHIAIARFLVNFGGAYPLTGWCTPGFCETLTPTR